MSTTASDAIMAQAVDASVAQREGPQRPPATAVRPPDLTYAQDETPPPLTLAALGFQHVAVICPYLVMVALVVGAAKLSPETARGALGLAMIAVAFLTVLQSLRLGPVGSGYLCPPVVSAIYLPRVRVESMVRAARSPFPVVGFEPSLMLPFAIAGIASGLRAVGVLTTCQQMNDAAWRRPDTKNIAAGVMADGIGCAVGGALGTPGMSASPSLVGIERITGATSRMIAWAIAGWLLLLACCPRFASLLINMPRPT